MGNGWHVSQSAMQQQQQSPALTSSSEDPAFCDEFAQGPIQARGVNCQTPYACGSAKLEPPCKGYTAARLQMAQSALVYMSITVPIQQLTSLVSQQIRSRPVLTVLSHASTCAGFDGGVFVFSGIPNKTYNILSTEVWCAVFNALLQAAAAWCSVLLCRGVLAQHVYAAWLPTQCQTVCPELFR